MGCVRPHAGFIASKLIDFAEGGLFPPPPPPPSLAPIDMQLLLVQHGCSPSEKIHVVVCWNMGVCFQI